MATQITVTELCDDADNGKDCLQKVTGCVLTENNGWVGLCFRHMTILVLESTARAMKPQSE